MPIQGVDDIAPPIANNDTFNYACHGVNFLFGITLNRFKEVMSSLSEAGSARFLLQMTAFVNAPAIILELFILNKGKFLLNLFLFFIRYHEQELYYASKRPFSPSLSSMATGRACSTSMFPTQRQSYLTDPYG